MGGRRADGASRGGSGREGLAHSGPRNNRISKNCSSATLGPSKQRKLLRIDFALLSGAKQELQCVVLTLEKPNWPFRLANPPNAKGYRRLLSLPAEEVRRLPVMAHAM